MQKEQIMGIEADANKLLIVLANWEEAQGHRTVDTKEVHRTSFGEWSPMQMNNAIQLLLEDNYIEDDNTIGSHPYEMNTLTLTIKGRLKAEGARSQEKALALNRKARQLLVYLYQWYRKTEGRSLVVYWNEETQRETGLDEAAFTAAAQRLIERYFAKYYTQGITLTPMGVQAAESPARLDHELPISMSAPDKSMDTGGAASDADAQFQRLLDVDEMVGRLAFVRDVRLRSIVERDLRELELSLRNQLNKASLILCGTLLEAVLLDVLDRRFDVAETYMSKNAKWPNDASLKKLVKIAGSVELTDAHHRPARLLTKSAVGTCNAIIEHRDLIHPHAEVRGEVKIDADVVIAMVGLLRVVLGDLSSAGENGVINAYETQ
jgi:hypothetical protein